MKYYIIDDQGAKLGGAEMTLQALIDHGESLGHSIEVIKTDEIADHIIDTPAHYILGNISNVTSYKVESTLKSITSQPGIFSKIEFDYGFMPYRGEIPYKFYTGQDYSISNSNCKPLYDFHINLRKNALNIFYMSSKQRDIFHKYLGSISSNSVVPTKEIVLSSCFNKKDVEAMLQGNNQTKEDICLVVNGRDTWQKWCKGVENAEIYTTQNSMELKIVRTKTHKELLEELAKAKVYILLPNIHDTCPRTIIEAAISGCKIIGNHNVQHYEESWFFTKTPKEIADYILDRPRVFWEAVDVSEY